MEKNYPLLKKIIRRERRFKLLFALALLFMLVHLLVMSFNVNLLLCFCCCIVVSSLFAWRMKIPLILIDTLYGSL